MAWIEHVVAAGHSSPRLDRQRQRGDVDRGAVPTDRPARHPGRAARRARVGGGFGDAGGVADVPAARCRRVHRVRAAAHARHRGIRGRAGPARDRRDRGGRRGRPDRRRTARVLRPPAALPRGRCDGGPRSARTSSPRSNRRCRSVRACRTSPSRRSTPVPPGSSACSPGCRGRRVTTTCRTTACSGRFRRCGWGVATALDSTRSSTPRPPSVSRSRAG